MARAGADKQKGPGRRRALAIGLAGALSVAVGALLGRSRKAGAAPLRPPGALAASDFLSACIRCFQCGSVCPNQCIVFEGMEAGPARAYTPYIRPREQACILCMKCTQVCPTEALTPIAKEPEAILKSVRMGLAKVNEELCFSYNGRICGVCYYACPFPDKALKLEAYAQPVVIEDACVGCGNCERACIHLPQAIRVEPIQESVA